MSISDVSGAIAASGNGSDFDGLHLVRGESTAQLEIDPGVENVVIGSVSVRPPEFVVVKNHREDRPRRDVSTPMVKFTRNPTQFASYGNCDFRVAIESRYVAIPCKCSSRKHGLLAGDSTTPRRPSLLARIPLAAMFCALALLVACSGSEVPRAFLDNPDPQPGRITRDIDALERIKYGPPQDCVRDGECPAGSHCDAGSETCTWECMSNSDCGGSGACNDVGTCVAELHVMALAGPSCPINRDQLLAVNGSSRPQLCTNDGDCACGSYCDLLAGGMCHVQCLVDNPPAGYTCQTGQTCSGVGRCETPGTKPALALHVGPADLDANGTPDTPVITANTRAAVQRVAVAVTIEAQSTDLLTAAAAATVRYRFRGIDDPSLPVLTEDIPPDPNLVPKVACASSATGSSECDLVGGWTFSGGRVSATRLIYVDLPKTTARTTWLLEATSNLAPEPATATVVAASVEPGAGHYRGTMEWKPAEPGPSTAPAIRVPVEVHRDGIQYAIVEPTRTFLPGGKIEVRTRQSALDPGWATLVPWLQASGGSYQVAVRDLADAAFSDADHISRTLEVRFGERIAGSFVLELDRIGDLDIKRCGSDLPSCAAETSCSTYMKRCLPGPTATYLIETPVIATVFLFKTLPSALVGAWAGPLDALVQTNQGRLGGTGAERVERAYCAALSSTNPSKLGAGRIDPSQDLGCTISDPAGGAGPQRTFDYVNRPADIYTQEGQTFELLEECRKDLDVQPTAGASLADLLASKPCVSLARFFLALRANASADGTTATALPDTGQRLVMQLLRQWLNLTTYFAGTTIKDRDFDDIANATGDDAPTRFAKALDKVESTLRVLLDPTVRPQILTGDLFHTLNQPDYRLPPRPTVHWPIDVGTASPLPDTDGTNSLNLTGTVGTGNALRVTGAATCASKQPVAMHDPTRYSIVAQLGYLPLNGTVVTLFDKASTDGKHLTLTGSTADQGNHVTFALSDGTRTTSFVAPWGRAEVPAFPFFEELVLRDDLALPLKHRELIAVVAEPGQYRMYVGSAVIPASSASEPQWGAAGTFNLGCAVPTAAACVSWDGFVAGDGAGAISLDGSAGVETVSHEAVTIVPVILTLSDARPFCVNTEAPSRRTAKLRDLPPGAPMWATNAFAYEFTSIREDAHWQDSDERFTFDHLDYTCKYNYSSYPKQDTGRKAVCGVDTASRDVDWDEISIWDRALPVGEYFDLLTRYFRSGTSGMPGHGLPDKPAALGGEQEVALPVHMVEAATAALDLVASYVDAEQAAIYAECSTSRPSDELVATLARAGRDVRLALVIGNEAAQLASLADPAAPWRARYDTARDKLAAKAAAAMTAIAAAAACRNPLNLSDQDIPLYVGTPDGSAPIEKFYASTRYLVNLALVSAGSSHEGVIKEAKNRKDAANNAYIAARQQAFQLANDGAVKQQRIQGIRTGYEAQLVKLCGARSSELLQDFLNGKIDAGTCFLARSSCSSTTPLAAQPADCLQGEIGERLVGLQTALIDVDTVNAAAQHAADAYGAQVTYCARRQSVADRDLKAYDAHIAALRELQSEQQDFGLFSSIAGAIMKLPISFVTGGPAGAAASAIGSAVEIGSAQINQDFANDIQSEQEAYDRLQTIRHGEDDVMKCYATADQQRFAVLDARDKITQATARAQAARIALSSARNAINGIVSAARSDLALENKLVRTPPQFHYWLDDNIARYQKQMRYARRLAYLTVQSYEYESQTTTGKRKAVLTARTPDDLQGALDEIWIRSRAFPSRNKPDDNPDKAVVLSLRDDILGLPKLAPGSGKTVIELFREKLKSEDSKYFVDDTTGRRFAGRAIRFALHGNQGWNSTYCGERMWRITPSIQMQDTDPPKFTSLLLYQQNTFGSQVCAGAPGTLAPVRLRDNANLLIDDSVMQFTKPEDYSFLTIDGIANKARPQLEAGPPGTPSGFAGRGLYGEFVLLFPKCDTGNNCGDADGYTDKTLGNLDDVLLRIDLVHGSNQP